MLTTPVLKLETTEDTIVQVNFNMGNIEFYEIKPNFRYGYYSSNILTTNYFYPITKTSMYKMSLGAYNQIGITLSKYNYYYSSIEYGRTLNNENDRVIYDWKTNNDNIPLITKDPRYDPEKDSFNATLSLSVGDTYDVTTSTYTPGHIGMIMLCYNYNKNEY